MQVGAGARKAHVAASKPPGIRCLAYSRQCVSGGGGGGGGVCVCVCVCVLWGEDRRDWVLEGVRGAVTCVCCLDTLRLCLVIDEDVVCVCV